MKVIHIYEEKSLRNMKKNEDADCTKCYFAEKTPDIEGGYVWLCHAALYDTKTLFCFVPRNTWAEFGREDEAVEITMRRLEALKDGSTTD